MLFAVNMIFLYESWHQWINTSKHVCILYHFFSLRWHRYLKLFLMEDKDSLIIMAADVLVTQGVRASAAMILTYFRASYRKVNQIFFPHIRHPNQVISFIASRFITIFGTGLHLPITIWISGQGRIPRRARLTCQHWLLRCGRLTCQCRILRWRLSCERIPLP